MTKMTEEEIAAWDGDMYFPLRTPQDDKNSKAMQFAFLKSVGATVDSRYMQFDTEEFKTAYAAWLTENP